MKILVVQDRLRSGGTERQSIALVRALGAAGHAAALLTFRPGGALGPEAAGLEVRSLQPIDLGCDWFAPGLRSEVRSRRPDVVLAMGRMANCYAGGLQRAFPGTAVVATMRTGKPLPRLFVRSLRLVRHVVANSEASREVLLKEHGLAPDRVSVIRNGLAFPPPPGPEAAGALRREFGAGPETAVLLSVAMFRPEKGQRELIEIASGLPREPGWQLWLAGDGPTRKACERLVLERGLAGRVVFPGFWPDPAALYAAADAAVHASESESLSNFLIEAQAAGLPAVASDARGVAECLVPGRTGWVVPAGDREGFRAAVGRLLREPRDQRAARSAEARAFARTAFDPDRQTAATLELFGRLAVRS
jgi:glycosyltransferase involved in cell wall biosynthesis